MPINIEALNETIAPLNSLIAEQPNNTRAYLIRGTVLMRNGYFQRALIDFNAVLAREPENARALQGRAQILVHTNPKPRTILDHLHSFNSQS